MNRYTVTQPPHQKTWVIFDRELYGYCSLPDDINNPRPNLLPLEWASQHSAEAWLQKCYRAWQTYQVPPPKNWKPAPPECSPWDAAFYDA